METLKKNNLILVNGKAGTGKTTFLVDIANSLKDKKIYFMALEGPIIGRFKLNDNIEVYKKFKYDFATIDKIANDYDVIIIDYLQLLCNSLNEEATTILSHLKELATKLNKTIIISTCESSTSIDLRKEFFKRYTDLTITLENTNGPLVFKL